METANVGCRDLVTNLPVERGTIFRLASMTKPLTTVAALMLYDEGRFALDEPITRHAPELARLRVLRDPNGPLDQTDAAERPITFGDLLTHRSGLTYGDFHRGPISRACAEALGGAMDNALGPDEWIATTRFPALDRSAGPWLSLRSVDRPARLPHRTSRRRVSRCRPRAAHLHAAGHGRHGFRRSSREARATRRPLRVRRPWQADVLGGRAWRARARGTARRHDLRVGRPGPLVDARRLSCLRAPLPWSVERGRRRAAARRRRSR